MALGRPIEAVEPLERALMANPDLPGAQLDLAQAFALQGDKASATSLLSALRGRPDVPLQLSAAIDTQLAALAAPALAADGTPKTWQTRLRFTSMLGVDSNLNNAPAVSEITLTLAPGDQQTIPLDPSSLAQRGGAGTLTLQWQGLRPHGEQLWIVQGEVRARRTSDRATSFEQGDLSVGWLQAPTAPRQWVARLSASHLRFGGNSLLHAVRAGVQRQFAPFGGEPGEGAFALAARCRPAIGAEAEYRRFPSSPTLTGVYAGAVAGFTCRPGNGAGPAQPDTSFVNVEARLGEDRPRDPARAGGIYRRGELRAQWERPVFGGGQGSFQWSTTRQVDTELYNVLLGGFPRRTLRHALQGEASWPMTPKLSLVSSAEASWQTSNITAFVSRQRSFYLGLRWELM